MIKVTPAAAEQIRKAAEQANARNLCLRIAVTQGDEDGFEYGMGFDERQDGDVYVVSEGIDIIVADKSKDVLIGAVLDYVEINPGDHRFIFTNPNDPAHSAGASPRQA